MKNDINMNEQKESTHEVQVKVQMTSGRIHYGMLLDKPEGIGQRIRTAWRFISGGNLSHYLQTRNPKLIELLPDAAIVSVDVH